MKKIFEKTEDVTSVYQFLKESVKEDTEFSKYLTDTYPDLKTLYDMKPGYSQDDSRSPERDQSFTGYPSNELH